MTRLIIDAIDGELARHQRAIARLGELRDAVVVLGNDFGDTTAAAPPATSPVAAAAAIATATPATPRSADPPEPERAGKPAPASKPAGARTGQRAGGQAGGSMAQRAAAVIRILDDAEEPLPRAALCDRLGESDSAMKKTLQRLVTDGSVVAIGKTVNRRYSRPVPPDGPGAAASPDVAAEQSGPASSPASQQADRDPDPTQPVTTGATDQDGAAATGEAAPPAPAPDEGDPGDGFRNTQRKVIECLAHQGPISQGRVVALVDAGQQAVLSAIASLTGAGHVQEVPSDTGFVLELQPSARPAGANGHEPALIDQLADYVREAQPQAAATRAPRAPRPPAMSARVRRLEQERERPGPPPPAPGYGRWKPGELRQAIVDLLDDPRGPLTVPQLVNALEPPATREAVQAQLNALIPAGEVKAVDDETSGGQTAFLTTAAARRREILR